LEASGRKRNRVAFRMRTRGFKGVGRSPA
jgi:hypothetical protein